MKRIEAKTLEEAYVKAAELLRCSVSDLEYEIIQRPTKGFLGLGAKNAVIVAACSASKGSDETPAPSEKKPQKAATPSRPTFSEKTGEPSVPDHKSASQEPKTETVSAPTRSATTTNGSEEEILENFFEEKSGSDDEAAVVETMEEPIPEQDDASLGAQIESELKALMATTCFDIDTVEVDVIDGTAYIFIDGEDAALLIGKEGYRYNALSYLLYNWLHNAYGLYIKLEIAQFLASQQEMIRHYIQPVIEHVRKEGWGKTRPLDGILVQIALEQLREEFPDKYVAIKRTREGERYVLITRFNKRS